VPTKEEEIMGAIMKNQPEVKKQAVEKAIEEVA